MHTGWIGVLEALVGSVAKEHLHYNKHQNDTKHLATKTHFCFYFFRKYISFYLYWFDVGFINTMFFLWICACFFTYAWKLYLYTCLRKTLSRRLKNMSAYCIYGCMCCTLVVCTYCILFIKLSSKMLFCQKSATGSQDKTQSTQPH